MRKTYTQRMSIFATFFFLFLFTFNVFGQVGIGNTNPKSALDVNGALSLREGPALSVGNGININLGTTIYSHYRITDPTADFKISTFVTPNGASSADGQLLTLINTTTNRMTIVHNQGSNANTQRRIYCPNASDLVLVGINSTVSLQYNLSLLRWVVVGYADMGGYGRNVYNKVGNTDTNTNSDVFSDMSQMSLTFTPKHSVVYVNFSASGSMDKGNNSKTHAYAEFQLMHDSQAIAGAATLTTDRSFLRSNLQTFYDSGESTNNYSNNEDLVWTFYPNNTGEKVSAYFELFATELRYDGLRIFDGPNTSAPPILSTFTNSVNNTTCPAGSWTGTTETFSAQGKTFNSTHVSGALTFRFTSDYSVTAQGWKALMTSGGVPLRDYRLNTAWNAGFTMYPVTVTPGVETTIKIQWLRKGLPDLPDVLRNNVVSNKDRSHRSLTILD